MPTKKLYQRTVLVCLLYFVFLSDAISQIVDPCFTTPAVGTTFASTADVHGNNSDCLSWDGTQWLGDWPWANITLAPPSGTPGTRAIWAGDGSVWTTGGEGFGLRLATPISTSTTYSYNFTRVSHGQGSTGTFSPTLYTNTGGSFGYNVGSIPTAGSAWFTGIISFTAVASQNGHTWIYFHTQNGGIGSGMFLACETPVLPMELRNLTGWHEQEGNQLRWEIENDLDYDQHVIERSADGETFTKLSTLNSVKAHNSTIYTFLDQDLIGLENKAYYRIASIHDNGATAYSPVVEVHWTIGQNQLVKMYPNPVKSGKAIAIQYAASTNCPMKISITNLTGKEVFQIERTAKTGLNEFELALPLLRKGIYQLSIHCGNQQSHHRLVII